MSNKRNFEDEEHMNQNKRIRSNSHINRSQSVTLQLSLNQLLNSSSRKELLKMNNMCEKSDNSNAKKCFNCSSEYVLDTNSCNFCERSICADCSLICFRCTYTYCGLCAVKSYQYSHQNNTGSCLSCH